MNRVSQAKAIVSAIIAVAIVFLTTLLNSDHVNWRTVAYAVVAGLASHQGTYWAPRGTNDPRRPVT